jgi:hypothetical protein
MRLRAQLCKVTSRVHQQSRGVKAFLLLQPGPPKVFKPFILQSTGPFLLALSSPVRLRESWAPALRLSSMSPFISSTALAPHSKSHQSLASLAIDLFLWGLQIQVNSIPQGSTADIALLWLSGPPGGL